MSIKVMTDIWAHAKLSGTYLLAMLAIADFANEDREAWPSISTLAAKCRVSPRQMQRIIKTLEAAGYVTVDWRQGRGHTNLYTLPTATQLQKLGPLGKGDTDDTPSQKKDDVDDTFSRKKDDVDDTFSRKKDDVGDTFSLGKGDIAMTHEPSELSDKLPDKENIPPKTDAEFWERSWRVAKLQLERMMGRTRVFYEIIRDGRLLSVDATGRAYIELPRPELVEIAEHYAHEAVAEALAAVLNRQAVYPIFRGPPEAKPELPPPKPDGADLWKQVCKRLDASKIPREAYQFHEVLPGGGNGEVGRFVLLHKGGKRNGHMGISLAVANALKEITGEEYRIEFLAQENVAWSRK